MIHPDFLLSTDSARDLYRNFAADQPIYDYHCHLPPEQIANNHQFGDIAEIWLGGDHYKWRALRSNGVSEKFVTGDASPREKFDAWVATMPYCLRNPLYHWSHLEMKRVFGLDLAIEPKNADAMWEAANAKLPELRVHDLLEAFKVAVVCTTDDPAEPLTHHEAISKLGIRTRVYPTFRPDGAFAIQDPTRLSTWLEKLTQVSGLSIETYDDLLEALEKRHADFHAIGCRISDHGLDQCWATPATHAEAAAVFASAKSGNGASVSAEDYAKYASQLMLHLGRWDAKREWTKQLHIGAQRNNNTRLFKALGPDTGFDSIGDAPQARSLAAYLDALDTTGELPRMVLYNLNPNNNYLFATMAGNFQDGTIPGKIQFGSGWWFLDQKEGMEWQINALSQLGLLRRFVGMLTDSRSFLSFPRHEYFRRILCNMLGSDMEAGILPNDSELIGAMTSEICFSNARDFFRLDLHPDYAG
jgi:glucuronate isomerase